MIPTPIKSVLAALLLSFMMPTAVEAATHMFLVEAARQYQDHPNQETRWNLERARSKAFLYDMALYAAPLVPLLYFAVRWGRQRKIRTA